MPAAHAPWRDTLSRGGKMGGLIATMDWSATPLGPIESWSPALLTTVNLALASTFPISIAWGPSHVQIYNDGYWPLCGAKHPSSMGQDYRECWASAFPVIGEAYERGWSGEASFLENQRMFLDRFGFLEETFFTFSFSPIRDETGRVAGLFHPVTETTSKMLSERRVRVLRDVAARSGNAKTVGEACRIAVETLAQDNLDLPFVLLYCAVERGAGELELELQAAMGLPQGGPFSPRTQRLDADHEPGRWPLAAALRLEGTSLLVDDLERRMPGFQCGPYPEPPSSALLLPIRVAGVERPLGVLVAGVSARLHLDQAYGDFYELLGSGIDSAIGNARAYEQERRRAEALAEIDKAKTTFFSNVSHEFRTPLTLMLGPLEDAQRHEGDQRALRGEDLDITYRNALRLLRLVNSLLDFSRIEAGRVQARYEPVDLSALTCDLASVFRAATERAGLRLRLQCEGLDEPVWVDREMWEKIVLNLVSNALKFTFEGEIEVAVSSQDRHAVLTVRDTGTGIAPDDVSRLFERFHQIEGARGRTHEGSGIGLALVKELVRLHTGQISVASRLGEGTKFTVTIPLGSAHLPSDRLVTKQAGDEAEHSPPAGAPVTATATAFVEEALRWFPDDIEPPGPVANRGSAPTADAKILVVDDNADLRAYLRKILRARWTVETAADGISALGAIRRAPPDLVVTDVMMPKLTGFELLAELRSHADTRAIPVIMLSARAGEEAKIEGIEAGADDYLIKPFSARELLARVGSQLALAAGRRERALLLERAQKAREDAESANRAKDDFLAMLGHELRNPLAPMLTALQLMRLRGLESREQDILERQVRHLARLVDDLLDASRIAHGKVELRTRTVETAEFVVQALEMVSALLDQRGIRVDVKVPRSGLLVEVDPARMAQVLVNLLTNAAKYSATGSLIKVDAMRVDGRVRIRVSDDGVGIAPDFINSIFDSFTQDEQTLARSRGGLGLGLAIVKSLVESHNGTVSAQSDGLGKGSVFTVELPAASTTADLEVAGDEVERGPAGTRILVVDDNEDAAQMLGDALQALGHEVAIAFDGIAALKMAETFAPQIALLDIGLPVMDGFELAARLRAITSLPKLHLVAISGYGQEADRRRASAAGFERHLVKPVDLQELARVLQELDKR